MKTLIKLSLISVSISVFSGCSTTKNNEPVALSTPTPEQPEPIILSKPVIPEPSPSERSVVKVDENSEISVEGQVIILTELSDKIDSKKVILTVNKKVPYRVIQSIMNELKSNGVDDIIFATTPN